MNYLNGQMVLARVHLSLSSGRPELQHTFPLPPLPGICKPET